MRDLLDSDAPVLPRWMTMGSLILCMIAVMGGLLMLIETVLSWHDLSMRDVFLRLLILGVVVPGSLISIVIYKEMLKHRRKRR